MKPGSRIAMFWIIVAVSIATVAAPAAAQPQTAVVQGFVCHGEEPLWKLDANRGGAQYNALSGKGKREVVFRGMLQPMSWLTPPAVVWRGDSTRLPRETLVVTMREEACKSTMADGVATTHRAIVTLKAGEAVAGCCTLRVAYDARSAPVADPAKKTEQDWSRLLPDLLPAINLCLAAEGAKAKWIAGAWPMNHGMGGTRIVETSGKSVDCVANLTGRGKPRIDIVNPADPPPPGGGNPLYFPARAEPPMVACGKLERVLTGSGAVAGYLHYDPC